jgi:hypothetical protein
MVPVQQCVPDVLAEMLRRQPTSAAKVAFAWRVAVGAALDRATTVALGHSGELRVVTSDSHWRREIERSAGLIVARLERLLGSGVVRCLVVDTPDR